MLLSGLYLLSGQVLFSTSRQGPLLLLLFLYDSFEDLCFLDSLL